MKFEYDEQPDKGECVAFIDGGGDLCIKADGNVIYITKDNVSFTDEEYWFDEFMSGNGCRKKFYPGDKITITF